MQMNRKPDETPPTYEEIVEYAIEANLIGAIDTMKFYQYYKPENFMYRGFVIDWKTKMHEWAGRQKRKVTVTAAEYRILNQHAQKVHPVSVDDLWDRVHSI